ncbi:MAG: MerR family transcriptional regulator [Elusimicrobia bacterium]|nr:MerR family transcriptional regulator [Elusimicrobiota bacterium]
MHIPGKKFFTIKETSSITKVAPHVLRYWEKEFQLLKPVRRESGQRRYTANHLHVIEEIKELLYRKKFTIAGAKKELIKVRKQNPQMQLPMEQNPAAIDMLKKVKTELKTIFKMLSKD